MTRIRALASKARNTQPAKPSTKQIKILDAAETIFVQRGFHGASLRDIAKEASVPLALLSYHFGSKDGLFRAVIERRAPTNAAGMRAALREAQKVRGGDARLEAVLRAFIAPVVERSMRGGPGWKNYIRLMATIGNLPQREAFVRAVPENYEQTVRSFIDTIRSIYPGMKESRIHWAFYFYQAAIIHILTESGIVDRQSDGRCKSSDLDTIVPLLVSFCAAGFREIAKTSGAQSA
jgi:AcrR family transcriptional regulator